MNGRQTRSGEGFFVSCHSRWSFVISSTFSSASGTSDNDELAGPGLENDFHISGAVQAEVASLLPCSDAHAHILMPRRGKKHKVRVHV